MSFFLIFVVLVVVLMLFAAGVIWLLLRHRIKHRDYPACGRCEYDVSATIGSEARCPECGAAFADVGVKPPARHEKLPRTAVFALITISAVLMLGVTALVGTARYAAASAAQARAQAAVMQAQAQQAAAQAAAAQAEAANLAAEAASDDATAADAPTPE